MTRYKCIYTDEYYEHDLRRAIFGRYLDGELCSNDPHFYQACDKKIGGKITNSEILCEHFICDTGSRLPTSIELGHSGLCNSECKNIELDREGCEGERTRLPTGKVVLSDEICDGKCNVRLKLDGYCEDEATCNGYRYGIYCLNWWWIKFIPPGMICDGNKACKNGADEKNCTVTEDTEMVCEHYMTGKLVPVHNYTRCNEIGHKSRGDHIIFQDYCKNMAKQQTNCSDHSRIALTCKINGFESTVSKYLICYDDTISACDDKIDSKCFRTKSCTIHRHLMCDKINDCAYMADETHPTCLSTTEATCKRRLGTKEELPIPISWLKDGVRDCENGVDETDDWPSCGVGKRLRYVSSKEVECRNVFICRTGEPGYVGLDDLCDGIESCGNENKICSVSNRAQSIKVSVLTTNKGLTKSLSYCLPGLINLELLISRCVIEKHSFPDENIFGMTDYTSVILPHKKERCDHMYGEQYLYTSCSGRCLTATCPLRNLPRYEVCPDQYPDRIGTIVNNEYLIFLTKSYGNIYTNKYFVCDDKIKCIPYTKVCDLVYDCNDKSDETECSNHFKCHSTDQLIPKTKKCDGKVDCFDFSDECNEQCSKEILEGYLLKGVSWLVGLLAVLANLVIIVKCLRVLKRCKTTVALINRFLILVIALGDFFVGCYLFIIATYDGMIFKRNYCHLQVKWITSLECSIIGVFSTIGSQISLFAMTGLSIVRMHGIWNSMRIPGEVTAIKLLKIVVAMLFLVISSAAIAVFPIMVMFEDFFVNGVKFSDEIKIFVGTSNKATILEVIRAYYGRTKNNMLDWKSAILMVRNMFSNDLDYKDLTEKIDKVVFYGNDGVCMFKYFVKNDDPQRLFVWSILSVNFVCFVFISLSYLLIGALSRRSSESLASSKNNRQIEKRNKRMNQRIAIIIATDFLCWIPFIVICVLHSLEVINATSWYSIFSMVILPINSVINPLLYDDAIKKILGAPIQALQRRVCASEIFRRFRGMINLAPEETPMGELEQSPRQASKEQENKHLVQEGTGRQALMKSEVHVPVALGVQVQTKTERQTEKRRGQEQASKQTPKELEA